MRILAVLLLFLAGCATQAVRTETVSVAVSVPCIAKEDVPVRPDIMREADIIKLDDFAAIVTLDKTVLLYESYTPLLEAVLAGCVR